MDLGLLRERLDQLRNQYEFLLSEDDEEDDWDSRVDSLEKQIRYYERLVSRYDPSIPEIVDPPAPSPTPTPLLSTQQPPASDDGTFTDFIPPPPVPSFNSGDIAYPSFSSTPPVSYPPPTQHQPPQRPPVTQPQPVEPELPSTTAESSETASRKRWGFLSGLLGSREPSSTEGDNSEVASSSTAAEVPAEPTQPPPPLSDPVRFTSDGKVLETDEEFEARRARAREEAIASVETLEEPEMSPEEQRLLEEAVAELEGEVGETEIFRWDWLLMNEETLGEAISSDDTETESEAGLETEMSQLEQEMEEEERMKVLREESDNTVDEESVEMGEWFIGDLEKDFEDLTFDFSSLKLVFVSAFRDDPNDPIVSSEDDPEGQKRIIRYTSGKTVILYRRSNSRKVVFPDRSIVLRKRSGNILRVIPSEKKRETYYKNLKQYQIENETEGSRSTTIHYFRDKRSEKRFREGEREGWKIVMFLKRGLKTLHCPDLGRREILFPNGIKQVTHLLSGGRSIKEVTLPDGRRFVKTVGNETIEEEEEEQSN